VENKHGQKTQKKECRKSLAWQKEEEKLNGRTDQKKGRHQE
jgi:hypothetical protein